MSAEAAPLLRVLVEGDAAAMSRALHPRVILRRPDGTSVVGREAVIRLLSAPTDGARHAVIEECDGGGVRVALQLDAISGSLRFTLRGACLQGRLAEVAVILP